MMACWQMLPKELRDRICNHLIKQYCQPDANLSDFEDGWDPMEEPEAFPIMSALMPPHEVRVLIAKHMNLRINTDEELKMLSDPPEYLRPYLQYIPHMLVFLVKVTCRVERPGDLTAAHETEPSVAEFRKIMPNLRYLRVVLTCGEDGEEQSDILNPAVESIDELVEECCENPQPIDTPDNLIRLLHEGRQVRSRPVEDSIFDKVGTILCDEVFQMWRNRDLMRTWHIWWFLLELFHDAQEGDKTIEICVWAGAEVEFYGWRAEDGDGYDKSYGRATFSTSDWVLNLDMCGMKIQLPQRFPEDRRDDLARYKSASTQAELRELLKQMEEK